MNWMKEHEEETLAKARAEIAAKDADMGNLAESIMVARQNGIPISQLLVIIDAAEDNPDANRLYRSIVLEAYERPRFMSASIRTRSIEDFRNDIETFCFASGFGG